MRTLNISISDKEYNSLGIKGDRFSFTEFMRLVYGRLASQNLQEAQRLAALYGLDKMTDEEIDAEIKAVRQDAKNNS